MTPTTITVIVDPEGNTRVAVEGVVGPACTEVAKGIEEALGRVASVTPTGEFYRRAEQRQQAGGR